MDKLAIVQKGIVLTDIIEISDLENGQIKKRRKRTNKKPVAIGENQRIIEEYIKRYPKYTKYERQS